MVGSYMEYGFPGEGREGETTVQVLNPNIQIP